MAVIYIIVFTDIKLLQGYFMEGMARWQVVFDEKARELYPSTDPSHDYLHIQRVVRWALVLAEKERADMNVVIPAAYFHDFVNVPKNDPRRSVASRLSAEAAVEYLASVDYPALYFNGVKHAIAAHSFSAGIKPETTEAKVVQDADRLDALGAIGLARLFTVSGYMQRPYYDDKDFWAEHRSANDTLFSIDHVQVKLKKIAETMNTSTAKAEAQKRLDFIQLFLERLKIEI